MKQGTWAVVSRGTVLGAIFAASFGLVACGKNQLHGATGAPIINGQRVGSASHTNGVSDVSGFNGESFGGDTLAASAALPKVMYFGFDKFNLNEKSQKTADQNVALLLKDPAMHVMLEGHTDPRGSESYNFHLGERRANAVQQYFLAHGVSASQVCTISFGELRPAASPADMGGNKLKAYALDRRVVVQYNQTCEGVQDASASAAASAAKAVKHKKSKPIHKAKKQAKKADPSTTVVAPLAVQS